MDWESILAITFIFGGGSLFLMAISPIGKAIAERIKSRGAVGGDELRSELAAHREALAEELEAVRREVAELAERVDFAERLLAKQREGERLAPPRSG